MLLILTVILDMKVTLGHLFWELCVFAILFNCAEPSISLGRCNLSCDEDHHAQVQVNQGLAVGPPGKAGPVGPPGSPGPPGVRGPIGESCDCTKYDNVLSRIVQNRFRDCVGVKSFIRTSGVSVIFPSDEYGGVHVYCDQDTDGGGWIVFQRRVGGPEDFYRGWNDYVTGFGSKEQDFWLGLETIHQLTNNGTWELRVDLKDFDGNTAFAKYSLFAVAGSSDNYRLTLSGYSGNASDSLKYHNKMSFSTKDRDNDPSTTRHCATSCTGAWWYNNCHNSNLNGVYNGSSSEAKGVSWYYWHSSHVSLKRAEMKIRRLD
ncbi:microfibril-associated glycoprotein 4-like [Styela clava]